MAGKEDDDWINNSRRNGILQSFNFPKTPKQVRNELRIKRFNLDPFIQRNLIKCLTPELCRGRIYVLTNKARKLMNLPSYKINIEKDWNTIGWIKVSQKERAVVLKIMAINSIKLYSEEIRERCKPLNPCLSRSSAKDIIKDLIKRGLVESEIKDDLKKLYWLSAKGKQIASDISSLFQEEYL